MSSNPKKNLRMTTLPRQHKIETATQLISTIKHDSSIQVFSTVKDWIEEGSPETLKSIEKLNFLQTLRKTMVEKNPSFHKLKKGIYCFFGIIPTEKSALAYHYTYILITHKRKLAQGLRSYKVSACDLLIKTETQAKCFFITSDTSHIKAAFSSKLRSKLYVPQNTFKKYLSIHPCRYMKTTDMTEAKAIFHVFKEV